MKRESEMKRTEESRKRGLKKTRKSDFDPNLLQLIEQAGNNLGYRFSIEGKAQIYFFMQSMWDGQRFRIPGTGEFNATPTQIIALVRGYLLQFHGFEPVVEFDPPLRPLNGKSIHRRL